MALHHEGSAIAPLMVLVGARAPDSVPPALGLSVGGAASAARVRTSLVAAHSAALQHLRSGGENITLNCGYGRGYSVLDVIRAKRISGADFATPIVNRRAGDISTVIANPELLRCKLDWKLNDDLDLIVDHAISW